MTQNTIGKTRQDRKEGKEIVSVAAKCASNRLSAALGIGKKAFTIDIVIHRAGDEDSLTKL